MKSLVAALHALADETRWRSVQLVLNDEMFVCELADIPGMPQSSISSPVQVTKLGGWLESEKCEKWIGRLFGVSPATDCILETDARQATKRLAEREKSCCPLPKVLADRTARGRRKLPLKLTAVRC